jgi:hypothetical protein
MLRSRKSTSLRAERPDAIPLRRGGKWAERSRWRKSQVLPLDVGRASSFGYRPLRVTGPAANEFTAGPFLWREEGLLTRASGGSREVAVESGQV